jgi:hypothetical protein
LILGILLNRRGKGPHKAPYGCKLILTLSSKKLPEFSMGGIENFDIICKSSGWQGVGNEREGPEFSKFFGN